MKKTTLARIGKIGIAIAFLFLIGAVAVKPARADDHGHHGDRHHEMHHWDHHGPHYVAPVPDYYYAPPANYYSEPEPSYYYAPGPVYTEPPPPSEGINLFFGVP